MKRCPRCSIEKPTSEFHKNAAQHDGLCVHCRSCYAAARVERQRLRISAGDYHDRVFSRDGKPTRHKRAELRFAASYCVDPATGCWLWIGAITQPQGYGTFSVNGKTVLTHRWSYEQFVGRIPKGTELDHLCRVRRCCNPSHLEAVSHRENVARGALVQKTHCKNGHEFTLENTHLRNGRWRACRACGRASIKRVRQRRRTEAA